MADDDAKTEKPEQNPSNDDLASAGWVASIFKPSVGLGLGAVLSGRGDERGGRIIATSIGVTAVGIVIAVIWFAVVMDKADDNVGPAFGSPALGKPVKKNQAKPDCTFESPPTKQQRQGCPGGYRVTGP